MFLEVSGRGNREGHTTWHIFVSKKTFINNLLTIWADKKTPPPKDGIFLNQ